MYYFSFGTKCKYFFNQSQTSIVYIHNRLSQVIAVLTDCDSRECEAEEGHVSAHVKFADAVRKFFNKLQTEEKKYKEKMDQLTGIIAQFLYSIYILSLIYSDKNVMNTHMHVSLYQEFQGKDWSAY